MKTIKIIIKTALFILIAATTTAGIANAQDSKKDKRAVKIAAIKNLVDSQNFVFVAEYVSPMGRGRRNLTSSYEVLVTKDTLISYLPYFGRAYSVPFNSTNIGFDFTSTNFDYQITTRKKSGWDILIKPKDQNDNQQLSFLIFNNGSASLNITSVNRSPISYQGYIAERKPKK